MNTFAPSWPLWLRANWPALVIWNELRGLAVVWAFGPSALRLLGVHI